MGTMQAMVGTGVVTSHQAGKACKMRDLSSLGAVASAWGREDGPRGRSHRREEGASTQHRRGRKECRICVRDIKTGATITKAVSRAVKHQQLCGSAQGEWWAGQHGARRAGKLG